MAEPNKKKTGGTRTAKTVTETARSKAPSSKKSPSRTTASTKGKKAPAKDRRLDPPRQDGPSKGQIFVRQFLPYIFCAIALFIGVCLVLDAIGGDVAPADHKMGPVGYYICYFLFGCLGWVAYLLPAVLIVLTVFWRRYIRTGRVISKVILSVLLLLLVSSLTHAFLCNADAALAAEYDPLELYRLGADFKSGGVIGGLLGYLLFMALRLPGTIALAMITLPLILVCLVGLTPMDVFYWIVSLIQKARANRAERRAEEEDDEDEEDDRPKRSRDSRRYNDEEEEDEPPSRSNRSRNSRYDDEDDEPRPKAGRGAGRRTKSEASRQGKSRNDWDDWNDDWNDDAESRSAKSSKSDQRKQPSSDDDDPWDDRWDDRRDARQDARQDARKESAAKSRRSAEEDPFAEDDPFSDENINRPEPEEPAREDDEDDADRFDRSDREENRGGEKKRGLFGKRRERAEAEDTARSTRPGHAKDDRAPWDDAPDPQETARTAYGDPEDAYDPDDSDDSDGTETMKVDFDDEPGAPVPARCERAGEAPSAPRHAPERPTHETPRETPREVPRHAAEDPFAEPEKGPEVTVHIIPPDASAVAERGLSEEEVVLPSEGFAEADGDASTREYRFPSVDMLTRGSSQYEANEEEIAANTRILREVLESFRIGVREISCSCGPTITRFEVKPDTGVRVRSIANLVDDIAMNLAKAGVRIEAPIPGKNAVGIEVPNSEPSTVHLRNILEAPEFRNHKSRIAACLGADVSGRPVILDINKMPHLLIAGATGMGKSVCINSIIMSILYKAKPEEVKLILIDPKKVEFAMYRDLPHLYAPIVSDPKKAAGALNSAVNEMERRFELIEEVGVRNLAGYNEVTADDPERPAMPQMVIIIDELADLMMTAPADVETAICRLAQKARAAGIHLIIGTQRPSVDVITGLIKANIPSRIAFTVASSVDSRTIIDTVGADKLIGRGDMLYAPVGATKPMRVQGTFVSETEVERVVSFIKENNDGPVYNEEFTHNIDVEAAKCGAGKRKGEQMSLDDFDGVGHGDGEDPKFWEALEVVVTKEKIGTSALQRVCKLGYGRAAKIIDRMEELGFVGPDDGTKQGRKVYITKQNLIEYKLNGLPGTGSDASEDGGETGGE